MNNIIEVDYVNAEEALSRMRGNKKLYGRMLRMFLAGSEMNKFKDSIAEKDFSNAASAAHTLKGIAGNLSLNMLFRKSSEIMDNIRQNNFKDEMYDQYCEVFNNTVDCVKRLLEDPEYSG